jgi:hypothetical protein
MPKSNPFVNALLRSTVRNPNLLHAGAGLLRGFAQAALAEKGVPENVREMLHALGDNAETAVVAVIAGTPAEKEVPAEAVTKAKAQIDSAPTEQGRSEQPGGPG